MAQPSEAESKLLDKLNNPQIGNRQASIVAASEAHATASFANVNTAMDALAATVNEAITKIGEAHGLVENKT